MYGFIFELPNYLFFHRPVHGKQLVHVFPAGAKTRDFVLSAQFTLGVQPVIEQARAGPAYNQSAAFPIDNGLFIVKAFLLNRLVQHLREFLQIRRLFFKFNQPLVTAFNPIPFHKVKIGGYRELLDRHPAFPASRLKGFFGLLRREILPENVDVLVRPANDDEFIRCLRAHLES